MTDFKKAIQAAADAYDADILTYFGEIQRPEDDYIIRQCLERRLRKNVILIIATLGGDPHVAYRIARALQRAYKTKPDKRKGTEVASKDDCGRFIVYVNATCKSAGTLLALGATTLILSDHADLGPIDVQLRKPEEVGERTSGLTPIQAVKFLENQSIALFERHFRNLRFSDDLTFSTKMAAETAMKLAVGLLTPIYQQIDPMRLAEVDRSLRIASEYGDKLGKEVLQDKALERLISEYPSHSSVIDLEEAKELFKPERLEEPSPELNELWKVIGGMARWYVKRDQVEAGETYVYFISEEPPEPGKAPPVKVADVPPQT